MKCPKCQFDNREEAKFCEQCGTRLARKCPDCGAEVSLTARFCAECGHDLRVPSEQLPKDLSFDEKLAKIQRYLPGGLTEKILAQRGKIEGERKQVTVMFCDMEGFTTLAEILSAEKVYSIMDEVFETLIHKVNEFGGTVNKMTGDGIMALFGAPIAVEDAPQRAIRSALAIHREMVRFGDRIKGESGISPIKMRIGIHTGPVVVGSLGNDLRVEFTAVGDTVNLASRMEGLAEPGTTYVTEDTFKLTEGLFSFEALGERKVKGKEAAVKAYRVIAPSIRRTRFDVGAERGLTPFVGRERELELLLDGFERARAGRGQAFSIMGEAGVGKSRLLYEFRKVIANEDVTFLEGRCFSYSRGVAYYPVIDLLKSTFNIRESDGDYQIRDKVKRGLKELGADEAHTLPYLLELLPVKDSGIDRIPMSPESRKDRILEALKRIVLKGAEIRLLIMAVEDFHWMDRGSEEVLRYLLESISGARVFFIFTYRPEYVPTWGGRSYHSQVTLNRLSNRESLAMVSHLLGTEEIDRRLEELILEKTEGIPFFIEEFIKSLKDLGMIERKDGACYLAKDIRDVTIPSTIQDVIMARVDSLPDAAKGVLQAGSVIEREFSYELIRRVTGMSEQELLSHLSASRESELLYERGIYPQSTYIFKHALTREVVYDSILTTRKKKLHVDTADAIEEIYKDNLDEHYEVLAGHYITGENYQKGAQYCQLAGRKAEKAASFPDAITYVQKRVSCLEKLPQTEDILRKMVDARTTLGLYLTQINHPIEAKEAVEPVVDLALKLGYQRRISQVYSTLGWYSWLVDEDYPRAHRYLTDALRIAEELNDILSLVIANSFLGIVLSANCEYEKASYHFGKALDINKAANNLWGIASIRSFIAGWVYNFQGKINLGFKESSEALQLAEESGDIYSKAYAYTWHGHSCYCKGFFREAEEHLVKGINFGEHISDPGVQGGFYLWLGETYLNTGKHVQAREVLERGVSLLEQHRIFPAWLNSGRLALALAKILGGDIDIELEPLYRCQAANKTKVLEGYMRRYLSAILLNFDVKRLSEAEDWIKRAIEDDSRNGMRFFLARDFAHYGELCKRKGDSTMAREKLSKSIEIFEECGADGWVKMTQEAAARL